MAIFIGSIVLGIVNLAFFRAHRSIEIVDAQRQTYQMVRIVMDRMVKDLACSYVPHPANDTDAMTEDELSFYRFVGTDEADQEIAKDSIRFTTTTDLGLPGSMGGVGEVGYYLKEMEDKKDRFVLIRSEDYLPHMGESKEPKEMEVAEDIVSMNIRYIDKDQKESDTWDLNQQLCLPRQVRITMTFDIEGTSTSFTGVAFLPLSHIKLVKGEGAAP